MRRVKEGELKPFGWSWWSGPDTLERQVGGFRLGIFGGTLYIPDVPFEELGKDVQFQEWFFRNPFTGTVYVLCHIWEADE